MHRFHIFTFFETIFCNFEINGYFHFLFLFIYLFFFFGGGGGGGCGGGDIGRFY